MTKAERLYRTVRLQCKDMINVGGYADGRLASDFGVAEDEYVCVRTLNAIIKLIAKAEEAQRINHELGILTDEENEFEISINKMMRVTAEEQKARLQKLNDEAENAEEVIETETTEEISEVEQSVEIETSNEDEVIIKSPSGQFSTLIYKSTLDGRWWVQFRAFGAVDCEVRGSCGTGVKDYDSKAKAVRAAERYLNKYAETIESDTTNDKLTLQTADNNFTAEVCRINKTSTVFFYAFGSPDVRVRNSHGTGCKFYSSKKDAILEAIKYVANKPSTPYFDTS